MENIKIGYVNKLPNSKQYKSGWIKDFNDKSFFLFYGIPTERLKLNELIVFKYNENIDKLNEFGKPRLDVVEVLEINYKEWLEKNISYVSKEEIQKLNKFNKGLNTKEKIIDIYPSGNLDVFFENGSKEEKLSLLHTLETALVRIDSENKYQQSICLISISEKYNLDKELTYRIYMKANAYYRYRLWLDNYVDYCNLNYLYRKLLEEKDKEIIESRLQFSLPEPKSEFEVYFKDIKNKIIENLSKTTTSLKIAMAWFTSYDIFEKLLELRNRNVSIDLIIINDLINNGGYCLNFNELIVKGGNLYLSEYPSLMHHKFCIIDDKILINGSYNWTYYAETINEENVLITKEKSIIKSFSAEFNRLIEKYPKVDEMPEAVPNKPEYDRSSFKHYITKELLIRANNKSGDEQIRLYHQAIRLAPNFPGNKEIKEKYKVQFDIINNQRTVDEVTKTIVGESEFIRVEESTKAIISTTVSQQQEMLQKNEISEPLKNVNQQITQTDTPKNQTASSRTIIIQNSQSVNKITTTSQSIQTSQSGYINTGILSQNFPKIDYDPLKCDNIILGIDNSGSMQNYYNSGLVNDIINKVISISLKYTPKGTIEVWTYNNQPSRVGEFSLSTLSSLKNIQAGGGTTVSNLVNKIQMGLSGKSLIIVLTDGEDNTIKNVRDCIANKSNSEFWQFIGLGSKFSSFAAVLNMNNMSFCSFDNIRSMTDKDIFQAMLSGYLKWMGR
jgi:hypothetical protein